MDRGSAAPSSTASVCRGRRPHSLNPKGCRRRLDLVEVQARATERRRFEHTHSGESYVIQAATGNLGLFDSDGLILTAKKIP